MSPSVVYQWVLCGPDGDEALAVSVLDDHFLFMLTKWLKGNFQETEASGRVLGICMVEESERFERIMAAGLRNTGGKRS